MYKVRLQNTYNMYEFTMDDKKGIKEAVLKESTENRAASFSLIITEECPFYFHLEPYKTYIQVIDTRFDETIYYGRVISSDITQTNEDYDTKTAIFESGLAFANDSIVDVDLSGLNSVVDILTAVVNNHNVKVDSPSLNLHVGDTSGILSNKAVIENGKKTMQFLTDMCQYDETDTPVYLYATYQGTDVYINISNTRGTKVSQTLTPSNGLVESKMSQSLGSIATIIYARGRTNDLGIYPEIRVQNYDAFGEYGKIYDIVEFDTEDMGELEQLANNELKNRIRPERSFDLRIADLFSDTAYRDYVIRTGITIQMVNYKYKINEPFIVSEMTTNILNPFSSQIVLGNRIKRYSTEVSKAIAQTTSQVAKNANSNYKKLDDRVQYFEDSKNYKTIEAITGHTEALISGQYVQIMGMVDSKFHVDMSMSKIDLIGIKGEIFNGNSHDNDNLVKFSFVIPITDEMYHKVGNWDELKYDSFKEKGYLYDELIDVHGIVSRTGNHAVTGYHFYTTGNLGSGNFQLNIVIFGQWRGPSSLDQLEGSFDIRGKFGYKIYHIDKVRAFKS